MKRRDFLKNTVAGVGLTALNSAHPKTALAGRRTATMKAGFARECITPPLGTTMMGFGGRDMDHGCDGIHDDIHARAIYVEHQGEPALIMGFDLCFLGREEADRFKGAIGRVMDLLPRQIFLNTSHNHVGPSVGTWYSAGYETPERDYLNQLERATVAAACRARDEARDATLSAGCTRTALPVNRRRPNEAGQIENRPYPDGKVYDRLPLCLFEDTSGKPICLLFSISTHPSMMSGWEISAEYPGAAMRCLDEYLGTPCSLFLQGVGGDSKPLVIGRGVDRWIPGTWELMDEAGAMVANEAIEALKKGLEPIEPHVQTASVEMAWALEPTPPRVEFEAVVENTAPESRPRDVQCLWAQHQLELLDKGLTLPTAVTLTAHGIRLGEGLRLIGIEGEAVHEWGYFIEDFYSGGTTFPLGYTDGTGLYLPTSRMLPEGGYEVVSSWEYGLPSRLAPGMEVQVTNALRHLRKRGIA